VPYRARTNVQHRAARLAGRPQLTRDPLGGVLIRMRKSRRLFWILVTAVLLSGWIGILAYNIRAYLRGDSAGGVRVLLILVGLMIVTGTGVVRYQQFRRESKRRAEGPSPGPR